MVVVFMLPRSASYRAVPLLEQQHSRIGWFHGFIGGTISRSLEPSALRCYVSLPIGRGVG
jgi:hypothetical protein